MNKSSRKRFSLLILLIVGIMLTPTPYLLASPLANTAPRQAQSSQLQVADQPNLPAVCQTAIVTFEAGAGDIPGCTPVPTSPTTQPSGTVPPSATTTCVPTGIDAVATQMTAIATLPIETGTVGPSSTVPSSSTAGPSSTVPPSSTPACATASPPGSGTPQPSSTVPSGTPSVAPTSTVSNTATITPTVTTPPSGTPQPSSTLPSSTPQPSSTVPSGTPSVAPTSTVSNTATTPPTATRPPSSTPQPSSTVPSSTPTTSSPTATSTVTPTYTWTSTPTNSPTPTPDVCPTPTRTSGYGDARLDEPETEQGDDSFKVVNNTTNVCEVTATLKIKRYYGPTEGGKIKPVQVGVTIADRAELLIEVAGEAGEVKVKFAEKDYGWQNVQAGTIRLTVDSDQIKKLKLPSKGANGQPPAAVDNNVEIKLKKKATTIKSVILLLPGMRPLIMLAGFNVNPNQNCGPDPTACKEPIDGYFSLPFDDPAKEMLEYPARNGHASLLEGNDSTKNGGLNVIEAANKALTEYGLRGKRDLFNPLGRPVGKVNILGHSMGGLWGRSAIFQYNRGRGTPVDKMIMLGSPHEGSNWANLLTNVGVEACLLVGTPEPPPFIADPFLRPNPKWLKWVAAPFICPRFLAIYPAVYNLTPSYMKKFNEKLLETEKQLSHMAAKDDKPVTYVVIAGVVIPEKGLAFKVLGSSDQVVSLLSAWGGNMKDLVARPNRHFVPVGSNRVPWPELPLNFEKSINEGKLVIEDTLHQAMAKSEAPAGGPSIKAPAPPRGNGKSRFYNDLEPYLVINKNNYELDPIRKGLAGGGGRLLAAGEATAAINPAEAESPQFYSYPTIYGQLSAGTVLTDVVAVDSVQSINFTLGWQSQTARLGLSLRDPSGQLITPASSYPGSSYVTDTLAASYRIDNPQPGNWQVMVAAAAGTVSETYKVSGGFVGGVQVATDFGAGSHRLGQPLIFTASLQDATPVNSAVITTTIFALNNRAVSNTLQLTAVGGGVYRGTFIPTVADNYQVSLLASGTDSRGHGFVREANTSFAASNAAAFNGSYAERAEDSDGDSFYNSLIITVGLNVEQPGQYVINGCLTRPDASSRVCGGNNVELASGSQQVALTFDGEELAAGLYDGAFQLRNLNLTHLAAGGLDLSTVEQAYSTASYSRYAWQRQDALRAGSVEVTAVDSDGNGRYNYLDVMIPLDVRTAGSYAATLNLVANSGVVIAPASARQTFQRGSNQLTLRFDGATIGASGQNGPYQMLDLIVANQQQSSYAGTVLAATLPYIAGDFEGGPTCTVSFSDLPTNHIFYGDIRYLACRRVISGYPNSNGTFRFEPNSRTTRGQFAKIAVNAFGLATTPPTNTTFSDVPTSNVFFNFVEAAAQAQVIQGLNADQCATLGMESPCYGPNLQVSRAQVAVITQRARAYATLNPANPTFRDVPGSNFAYVAVETLAGRGIINGANCASGGGLCFRPNDAILRGELSKVTRRSMENLP